MASVKHIAVIRLSAMGDVAMIVPVLRAFVKQYPKVRPTMVSKPFFEPFFTDIPNVDFFGAEVRSRHKGIRGILRLYHDLSSLGVDAVADLHNVLRSKIIRRLFLITGRKASATDKARSEKKALTRPDNKIFGPLKHVCERHAETFSSLGFPIDLSKIEVPAKPPMPDAVKTIYGETDVSRIGIAPFAQHQGKVYPEDLMRKVLQDLDRERSMMYLFGSGEKETKIMERLSRGLENITIVTGKLSFADELKLIANLDVMLSMDSGNAHIAAMYGVPTVTLWGATHPYAGFSPFGQPIENAITSDRTKYPKLPTSIYGNKIVPGYEDAMRTIAPEVVVDKILTIIKLKANS